jgi:hypothetical protein
MQFTGATVSSDAGLLAFAEAMLSSAEFLSLQEDRMGAKAYPLASCNPKG